VNSAIGPNSHVVISCEGTAEEVIARKLCEADRFIFPRENVIDVTRIRMARGIEEAYLNVE
jgi:hypothetical protein